MTTPVTEPVTPPATTPVAVTPPVTAPVAAPVTEPAAPNPQPVQEMKGFTPTGDPGIDLALGFFSKHGLTEAHPAVAEAAKGNFDYLKAHFAEMGAKAPGWEQYLALAEKGYANFQQSEQAALEARQKTVFDAVGGEENWNAVQDWTMANADATELPAIKTAIKQGGLVATAVAQFLHAQYSNASGTTLEPANATTANPNPAMQGQPLSRQGYRSEVAALQAKIGASAMDSSPEYAALKTKYAGLFR